MKALLLSLLFIGGSLGASHFASVPTPLETIPVNFTYDGARRLSALLGVSNPSVLGTGQDCSGGNPLLKCRSFGDYANLTILDDPESSCSRVEWTSLKARRLEDCFIVDDHMYGGPESKLQFWPINPGKKKEAAYETADYLQGYNDFGNIVETYFLFARGSLIHVDEDVPLFLSYDTKRPGQLCFVAEDRIPYYSRSPLKLSYTVCTGPDVKTVHRNNFPTWYKRPSGLPDQEMLLKPLWSTWAQFRADVDQQKVLDLARDIVGNGFQDSSHVEIDDRWEDCYGENGFDPVKFPTPKEMVDTIKRTTGFRVTLWVHAFINANCPAFDEGIRGDYFIKDSRGKPAVINWWAGAQAGAVDVTSERAVEWWHQRLNRLKTEFGIDSFKFDGGEVNWLHPLMRLEGNSDLGPNLYTTKYVEAVAPFGGLIEARTGRNSQEHPIFFRLMDRDSHWRQDAGLKSMIPSVLLLGILGYPFILPDMIGGSGPPSNPFPSEELYLRWVQLNVFMPAVQFSIFPWDPRFDTAITIPAVQELMKLREQYHDVILACAQQAVEDGSPINRPIWWADPTDPETFAIEQAYMLGDDILVYPVAEEGAVTKDVYLPRGNWIQGGGDGTVYTGPMWLRDFPAPLTVLPYFIRSTS